MEGIKASLKREKVVIKEEEYEKWYFRGYKEALEWVLEVLEEE